MRQVAEFYVGTVPGNIKGALSTEYLDEHRISSMLLTSVDSVLALAGSPVETTLRRVGGAVASLGSGLVVPSAAWPLLAEQLDLLHGFDELWLFQEPPLIAKPQGTSIVSPLCVEEEDIPPRLLQWMRATRCAAGLGDGEAMNFITPHTQLARQFMKSA
jgi:hypothetical protein